MPSEILTKEQVDAIPHTKPTCQANVVAVDAEKQALKQSHELLRAALEKAQRESAVLMAQLHMVECAVTTNDCRGAVDSVRKFLAETPIKTEFDYEREERIEAENERDSALSRLAEMRMAIQEMVAAAQSIESDWRQDFNDNARHVADGAKLVHMRIQAIASAALASEREEKNVQK